MAESYMFCFKTLCYTFLIVCLFNVCKVRYKIHTIPFTGTEKSDTEKGKMSVQGVKLRLIQAPMRLNFSL